MEQLKGGRTEPYGQNEKPDAGGKLPAPPENPTKVGSYKNWDYSSIERKEADTKPVYNRYRLPELKKSGWVSATLTWDRVVTANDDDKPVLKGFKKGAKPADLNLYLMKAGETDVTKNVWSSDSTEYNLETIMYQLQDDAKYELWVEQKNVGKTDYALTWWTTEPKQGDKKIQGSMWEEQNGNDRRDVDEAALQYAIVELYDATTNTVIDSVLTDYTGEYSFDVVPGDYYLTFSRPFGYEFITPNVGDDDYDSDTDTNGRVDVTVSASDTLVLLDAGVELSLNSSISDFVWLDQNANGIREITEVGVSGVQVSLYSPDGDFLSTTQTDLIGGYTFSSLPRDNYLIQFDLPANYTFTTRDAGGNDLIDSDVDPNGMTDVFSLNEQQQLVGISAGLVLSGVTIRGLTWIDRDADGLQDADESAFPSHLVSLHDASSDEVVAETYTRWDGSYEFLTFPPGSYYVGVAAAPRYQFTAQGAGNDSSIDSDVDASGRTNTFTLSLGQVITNLDAGVVSTNQTPVVNNDTADTGILTPVIISVLANDTDADNDVLRISSVTPGAFGTVTINPDFTVTYTPDGTFASSDSFTYTVSDGHGGTATGTVTVNLGTVGGRAWIDGDGDGLQGAGETGLDGVTIELLDDVQQVLAATFTANGGYYSFTTDLTNGYFVRFVSPAGYSFTTQDVGSDDTLDSDADPSTGVTSYISRPRLWTLGCTSPSKSLEWFGTTAMPTDCARRVKLVWAPLSSCSTPPAPSFA